MQRDLRLLGRGWRELVLVVQRRAVSAQMSCYAFPSKSANLLLQVLSHMYRRGMDSLVMLSKIFR